MTHEEKRILRKRLQNAENQTAEEFRGLYQRGAYDAAELVRQRWKMLLRAEMELNDFDFEE